MPTCESCRYFGAATTDQAQDYRRLFVMKEDEGTIGRCTVPNPRYDNGLSVPVQSLIVAHNEECFVHEYKAPLSPPVLAYEEK